MSKRWKYFAIYASGFALFAVVMVCVFGIAWTPINSLWLGLAYFIANVAGDVEHRARHRDAQ